VRIGTAVCPACGAANPTADRLTWQQGALLLLLLVLFLLFAIAELRDAPAGILIPGEGG
jgi:hypothetical protein